MKKEIDRMADSSRMRRADRVVVESCWCFGRMDRKRLKEVVDSGFERCRMRLPQMRSEAMSEAQAVEKKRKILQKQLDRLKGCCRMRGLG